MKACFLTRFRKTLHESVPLTSASAHRLEAPLLKLGSQFKGSAGGEQAKRKRHRAAPEAPARQAASERDGGGMDDIHEVWLFTMRLHYTSDRDAQALHAIADVRWSQEMRQI